MSIKKNIFINMLIITKRDEPEDIEFMHNAMKLIYINHILGINILMT